MERIRFWGPQTCQPAPPPTCPGTEEGSSRPSSLARPLAGPQAAWLCLSGQEADQGPLRRAGSPPELLQVHSPGVQGDVPAVLHQTAALQSVPVPAALQIMPPRRPAWGWPVSRGGGQGGSLPSTAEAQRQLHGPACRLGESPRRLPFRKAHPSARAGTRPGRDPSPSRDPSPPVLRPPIAAPVGKHFLRQPLSFPLPAHFQAPESALSWQDTALP